MKPAALHDIVLRTNDVGGVVCRTSQNGTRRGFCGPAVIYDLAMAGRS